MSQVNTTSNTPSNTHSKTSLYIMISLVLCNVLWSANPLMAKWVIQDFNPAFTAWFRSVSGLLGFLFFAVVYKCFYRTKKIDFFPSEQSNYWRIFILASIGFCAPQIFCFIGLSYSSATDNSLIVALEPILSVLLASVFLKEHLSISTILIFLTALLGFLLLSQFQPKMFIEGLNQHALGNLLILIAVSGDASYSVFARSISQKVSPTATLGATLLLSSIVLSIYLVASTPLPSPAEFFHAFTWKSLLGIFWLGPIGSTASYLLWIIALQKAEVAKVTLTLFIQPLAGTLWGYLFLSESLFFLQIIGAFFILMALSLQLFQNAAQRKV